jgi:hypothetical protein
VTVLVNLNASPSQLDELRRNHGILKKHAAWLVLAEPAVASATADTVAKQISPWCAKNLVHKWKLKPVHLKGKKMRRLLCAFEDVGEAALFKLWWF